MPNMKRQMTDTVLESLMIWDLKKSNAKIVTMIQADVRIAFL